MAIDDEQVRHIAALARLDLDPATVAHFRRQLKAILDYVAMLDEIDLEEVPPTAQTHLPGQPLREDGVTPCLPRKEALANSPDNAEGHFRVPRVLADG